MKTEVIVCPSCGEVLERTAAAWERHREKERKVWVDRAHKSFDPIWKSGIIERHLAYGWLAHNLMISYSDCHFSNLSIEQLKQAIDICESLKMCMRKVLMETTYGESVATHSQPFGKWGRNGFDFAGIDRCTPTI